MGQKLALILATAEYQDAGLARLLAPGLDAHDLAGALRSPEIGAFDSVQLLLNETEPAARRAIARFFTGRKPDDLLLLYFSGHGVRDEQGQLYLAVTDTDRSLLSATAIPAQFINEHMNTSRSRRQVLILDCCNSGAFAQGSKGGVGGSMGIATAFEGTGYGRVVLTATDATQYAWEGDEARGEAANSVFTHYLVQGLETGAADADGDGRITLDELYDYVYEQVVTQTPRQTPRKFAYNQQGELVIASNPRPAAVPAALSPELRQALESPLPSVREAAVAELERLVGGSHAGLSLAALDALEALAQDDSRRVSAAAAAVLAANAAAQQRAQATEVRQEVAQAEQVLAAQQKLEAERRAAAQAQHAAAEAEAARQAQAQREAAAQAERERLAAEAKAAAAQAARAQAEQAERERMARVEAAAKAAAEAERELIVRERAQAQAAQAERERAEQEQAASRPAPAAPSAAQPAKVSRQRPTPEIVQSLGRPASAAVPPPPPYATTQDRTEPGSRPGVKPQSAPAFSPARVSWRALAPWLATAVIAIGAGFAATAGAGLSGLITGNLDFDGVWVIANKAGSLVTYTLGGLATFAVLVAMRAVRPARALGAWLLWSTLTFGSLVLQWVLFYHLGWPAETLYTLLVFGAGPALAVSWALWGRPRWATLPPTLSLMAGWTVALLLVGVIGSDFGLSVFWAGALLGTVGGGVTVWQAGRKVDKSG